MGVSFSSEIGLKGQKSEVNELRKSIDAAKALYLQKLLEADDDLDSSQGTDSSLDFENDKNFMPDIQPMRYNYPFDSLVFQGSGYKGIAYCGAVNLLEEIGLLKKIRRFGGSSWGALPAALLAAGYSTEELQKEMTRDYRPILHDCKFGLLSHISNMLKGYGWYTGNRFMDHIGFLLAEKFGDPDITFSELYKKTGNELCIVVTNVNLSREEYCHVKTNPNMPVRLAVRISIGIPGMFQPAEYGTNYEQTDYFVEGGFLCNYPIHCFDGWYLSMKPDDGFIKRLQPLEKIPELMEKNVRFEYYPEKNKTIGLIVFKEQEYSSFRQELERKHKITQGNYPDTKLSRKYLKNVKISEKSNRESERIVEAVESFIRVLQKHNLDGNDIIDKTEFENAFNDEGFSTEDSYLLFGENCTAEMACNALDEDKNGVINFQELMNFVKSNAVALREKFLVSNRLELTGFYSFVEACEKAMMNCVEELFMDTGDTDRSVGINTGYIDSTYDLEPKDKEYLISQGRKAMEDYLKSYAVEKELEIQH